MPSETRNRSNAKWDASFLGSGCPEAANAGFNEAQMQGLQYGFVCQTGDRFPC